MTEHILVYMISEMSCWAETRSAGTQDYSSFPFAASLALHPLISTSRHSHRASHRTEPELSTQGVVPVCGGPGSSIRRFQKRLLRHFHYALRRGLDARAPTPQVFIYKAAVVISRDSSVAVRLCYKYPSSSTSMQCD